MKRFKKFLMVALVATVMWGSVPFEQMLAAPDNDVTTTYEEVEEIEEVEDIPEVEDITGEVDNSDEVVAENVVGGDEVTVENVSVVDEDETDVADEVNVVDVGVELLDADDEEDEALEEEEDKELLNPTIEKMVDYVAKPDSDNTEDLSDLGHYVGHYVRYAIMVTNDNDEDLNNHLVVDNLANGKLVNPRNLEVIPNINSFSYEIINGELQILLDYLPANETLFILFEARIADEVEIGDVLVNIARLYRQGDEDYIDYDYAELLVVEQLPIFEKTSNVGWDKTVELSQTIEYTITITNPRNDALYDLLVIDDLARGDLVNLRDIVVDPQSALVEPFEVDDDLRLVLNIEPGEVVTITYVADIADILQWGVGDVVNFAVLQGPPNEEGRRSQIRSAFEALYLDIFDLDQPTITKESSIGDGDEVVERGEYIKYTLTITNPNDATLGSHLVVDDLAGGGLVGVRDVRTTLHEFGQYEIIDGELRVNLLYLPSGDDVVITFYARVADDAEEGGLVNTARLYELLYVDGDVSRQFVDEDYAEVIVYIAGDKCPICPTCPNCPTCPPCPTRPEPSTCGSSSSSSSSSNAPGSSNAPSSSNASGSSNAPGRPGGGGGGQAPSTAGPSSSAPTLPQTGIAVGSLLLSGLLLAGTGLVVASKKKKDE